MDKIKTIFDTDPGVDDAFALAFLHHAKIFDVLMLSSVAGNVSVENTTRNLRGLVGAMDWDVPIYKGLAKPILRDKIYEDGFHGSSGLSGYIFDESDLAPLSKGSAISAMEKLLEANDQVLIIGVGPLTNIGSLILARPDLKEKISEITIMGGAVGMGNISPVAEFNIYQDPEAANIVFNSGIKINMLGLNVTTQTSYDSSLHEEFKKSDKKINQILAQVMENRVAKAYYGTHKTTYLHDLLTVMYMSNPEIFSAEMVHMDIETRGEITRGMTVADMRDLKDVPKNVNLVTHIDQKRFKEILRDNLL